MSYEGLSPYIADSIRRQERDREQERILKRTLADLNLPRERARLLQQARALLGDRSIHKRAMKQKESIQVRSRYKRYGVSPQTRAALYARDGGRCYICARTVGFAEMHLDHVIPLVRGGNNSRDNLRVACEMCNTAKGSMMLSEYLDTLAPKQSGIDQAG